jgi:hypothetical protein
MGAIPITSRFNESIVAELTEQFDLGPPTRSGRIADDPEWLMEWAQAVVAAVSRDQTAHRCFCFCLPVVCAC